MVKRDGERGIRVKRGVEVLGEFAIEGVEWSAYGVEREEERQGGREGRVGGKEG